MWKKDLSIYVEILIFNSNYSSDKYGILYNYLLIGTMRCDILDITSETINVREQICRLPVSCKLYNASNRA